MRTRGLPGNFQPATETNRMMRTLSAPIRSRQARRPGRQSTRHKIESYVFRKWTWMMWFIFRFSRMKCNLGKYFSGGEKKNNTGRRCFYAKVPCCGGARRQSGLWPWKGRQQGCKGDEGRGDIWTAHLSAHLHFSPHIPPHGRLAAAAGVGAFWKNAFSRAPECAGFTTACWDYSIKPTADYWTLL